MLRATVILLIVLGVPASAAGATLEPLGSYETPLYVTSDPDDPDRIFVVEQAGEIELTTPTGTSTFLDIKSLVRGGGEQGLLSMAFAPDYSDTGLFYVFYTGVNEGNLHIDEFRAVGNSADPATRRPVLRIGHAVFGNHNGGQLQFGPDGLLYISTGDGGGGGDQFEAGQDLTSLLGKILRIDPRRSGSAPYTIPAGNPFAGTDADPVPGARDEIWSYGLRNPWRFSFDRLTGDLVIGDVGQGLWEEIDWAPREAGGGAGLNFGWDCREGAHDFELTGCESGGFTDPVFEYTHDTGNCSVTGGYVVRDPALTDLYGRYAYADFCASTLRSLALASPTASDDRSESIDLSNPTSFGEDACGRLYATSIAGPVWRLAGTSPSACAAHTITVQLAGGGAGRVTGPGIDCPGDCTQRVAADRRIELTAVPGEDSRHAGWSDPCGPAPMCGLVLSADRTVTASFESSLAGAGPQPQQSTLSIGASKRRVAFGERFELSLQVVPCPGRAGAIVTLLKRGHPWRTATLDQACTATLEAKLRRTAGFRAQIAADTTATEAAVGPLRVTVRRSRADR